MKILNSEQFKQLDASTIANEPILSINLMERAARACVQWIENNISVTGDVKIFVGPGNNGGDGLAIARLLADKNQRVRVYTLGRYSADALVNYKRLISQARCEIVEMKSLADLPVVNKNDILIDALVGYGLNKPLEGFMAQIVNHINGSCARIIAIDIPSGLFVEDNSMQTIVFNENKCEDVYENVVCADFTLTFEAPFLSFFFAECDVHVGRWHVLPIGMNPNSIDNLDSKNMYINSNSMSNILRPRKKFSHKGTYGHALLITGGIGKIGAGVLAARACLRSGVGLVTSYVPRCGYEIMQTSVPEAMVIPDPNGDFITQIPNLALFNAIGIGPGIGVNNNVVSALQQLLQLTKIPLVVDADAINIFSQNKQLLDIVPENSIFTPHFREFERLVGRTDNYVQRIDRLREFAVKYKLFVILKSAYSLIATPRGEFYFNSTGNPGMATGGCGDVLTGMVTGLFAQGYSSLESCKLGVYLHGLAGDYATKELGEYSVIAGDVINKIPDSIKHLLSLRQL